MDVDAEGTTQNKPKHEVIVDATFDENKTYAGKVKAFRHSFRVTIIPDEEDLIKNLGGKGKTVECSASDIKSSQSPAILAKDQAVEFRLRKDNWGIYAISCTAPGGQAVPHGEPREKKEQKPRSLHENGKTFMGEVKNFLWRQGFGFVELSEDDRAAFAGVEIKDKKAKKRFEKSGELWFHRDDIQSTDSAVGVEKGDMIQFQVYTDEKGIGATNVCHPGGIAITGANYPVYRGPAHKKKKKKKKQNPQQAQMEAMLKKMMGFGKSRGRKNKQMMMVNPMMMGGMNPMMMNPMMQMMGGGMPMMMNMGGQPYMMVAGGKKKRKKNKKKKTQVTYAL